MAPQGLRHPSGFCRTSSRVAAHGPALYGLLLPSTSGSAKASSRSARLPGHDEDGGQEPHRCGADDYNPKG